MSSKTYGDLELWQKAMDLVVECYPATRAFPKSETFALSGQMQRAAVSVPANLAEGHGRKYRAEFIKHLFIAHGSLAALETHIHIAQRLQYLGQSTAKVLLDRTGEVGRLLNGLLRFLRGKREPE
jgi:four helix bundle protein